MRLLAVDLGFTTGYALLAPPDHPVTGSVSLVDAVRRSGHDPSDLRAIFSAGHGAVLNLIETHWPDRLVLCTPFVHPRFVDIRVVKVLFGLYAVAGLAAFQCHVPLDDVHEQDARKAFLGRMPSAGRRGQRSKAIKAAVIAACEQRGFHVCDDHAADALVAAIHRLTQLEPGTGWGATPLGIEGEKHGGTKAKSAGRRQPRTAARISA